MTMCDKKNIETSENCVLSAPDFLRCSLAFFSLHSVGTQLSAPLLLMQCGFIESDSYKRS